MIEQSAPNINILSFKKQDTYGVGKFLAWSLQYGRIIIIVTEMLVIGAFISRFYFDTQLANLHDQMQTKETLIEQSQGAEQQFLNLQARVNAVGQIIDSRKDYSVLLNNIANLLPSDITITNLSIIGNTVTMSAQVGSANSLNTFVQNINTSSKFSNPSLDNLAIKDGQLQINVTATILDGAYQ